ncbi:MAG: PEP-CTERM sorting domain-containing protein, partial [Verrucomicrobia bacterium]
AAIPEPGTYALIFGAAALVFAVWRRRRSASVTA